jgi:hypothetical protein
MKKIQSIIPNISFFDVVFVLIAIATFRNSYWSVSYVFDGTQPSDGFGSVIWVIWGAFFAFCVDFGMFKLSQKLMQKFNFVVLFAYTFAAFISVYLQIIYASYHTTAFEFSSGINSGVLSVLTDIVNWRLIVLPISLPLFSVIYTLANSQFRVSTPSSIIVTEPDNIDVVDTVVIEPEKQIITIDQGGIGFRCKECGREGVYGDRSTMEKYSRTHVTRMHKGLDWVNIIEVLE